MVGSKSEMASREEKSGSPEDQLACAESTEQLNVQEERDGLSLDFEGVSTLHAEGELAVPLSPRYATYKKLEVISSRRINSINLVYNTVIFIALMLSVIVIILARTKFSVSVEGIPGLLPDLTFYEFPPAFSLVDAILSFAVFAYAVVMFVVFTRIVLLQGMNKILNEQVWVMFLLAATVAYLMPYEAAIRLRRDFQGHSVPDTSVESSVFAAIRMVCFSFIQILYLWLGTHSYRFLERPISVRDWKFYLPKIAAMLVYNIYKLTILFVHKITFSELPLASFVGFLSLYAKLGKWPKLGIITVVSLTVMELLIVTWIGIDIYKTIKRLSEAEYTKYRTKIVGFRFFLHQQVVFNAAFIVTYAVILFGLPNDIQALQFVIHADEEEGRGSYFDVQYAPFGLLLCLLAFVSVEMYSNLPAKTSVRNRLFPCMFGEMEEGETLLEPVLYRSREASWGSEDSINITPNCFVMQTNIDLFNLSWFVYYSGTKKEATLNINNFKLKPVDSIYDAASDTRVIIAEAKDRIVFAFKGTSSNQNVITDLKVMFHSLSQVVEDCESAKHLLDGKMSAEEIERTFRRCKIHSGFAEAYAKVKHEVRLKAQALIEKKRRPILVTGHSLGGALATICSLDLRLTLGIGGRDMYVSTFGSPRVGNEAFTKLYDCVIAVNWRFVAGGDVISRLPKGGYRHVGKKVMLTRSGELFIDPSALEMIFWHSQGASIVHHRKSWYLLAMKRWCESVESDYTPHFWPFPVSENESRKFEGSFRSPRSNRVLQGLSPTSRGKIQRRQGRLQEFAEAIDGLDEGQLNEGQLNEGGMSDVSKKVVDNWTRLVKGGMDYDL